MDEERDYERAPGRPEREGAPDTAEGERGREISKKVPEEISGEGETPLGSTDQHSDAPGPHGLGEERGEDEQPPEDGERA